MINVNAQTNKGIHLQAIARNEQGIIIPNKQITLRLSILNDTILKNIEYQEIISVTTNVLGLFFVNVGADNSGKVVTGDAFNQIQWNRGEHFLQVEVDPNNALSFTIVGVEKINYVPLALYAEKANTVNSIIPIELGGTSVSSIKELSKLLNIDKVNNTPDSLKPISAAVNIGLNDKLKKADTASLSNRINTKITIGNITLNDITNGLGYTPVKNNYGQFYDTGRQTALVNTATAIKFNFQQLSNKTIITNNTNGNPTRLTVTDAGIYHINYTTQFIKSDLGNDELSIWIRRNGSAYPNTNIINVIQGNGVKNIFSGSYNIDLGANDYIELFFSIKNINSNLVGSPSTTVTPSRPATPSALISLHAVN
jgi:hypothetical protein